MPANYHGIVLNVPGDTDPWGQREYEAFMAVIDLSRSKLDASAYTASDVLLKLLTVDGSGSGLDADMLDGHHASEFAWAGHGHDKSAISGLNPNLLLIGSADGAISQDADLSFGLVPFKGGAKSGKSIKFGHTFGYPAVFGLDDTSNGHMYAGFAIPSGGSGAPYVIDYQIGGTFTHIFDGDLQTGNGGVDIASGKFFTIAGAPHRHDYTTFDNNASHRFVTDTQIALWTGKQDAGSYEPAITKNVGIAKWLGSAWSFSSLVAADIPALNAAKISDFNSVGDARWSLSTHNHSGVYEPVIAAGLTTQVFIGNKTWVTLNTSIVPEGTNLYFTNARVKSYADTVYLPLAGGTLTGNTTVANATNQSFLYVTGSAAFPVACFLATRGSNTGANSYASHGVQPFGTLSAASPGWYWGLIHDSSDWSVWSNVSGVDTQRLKIDVSGNVFFDSSRGDTATATPFRMNFGRSFSNGNTRDSLKISLYDDGGVGKYGFGIGSNGDIQHHSQVTHDFYMANAKTFSVGIGYAAVMGGGGLRLYNAGNTVNATLNFDGTSNYLNFPLTLTSLAGTSTRALSVDSSGKLVAGMGRTNSLGGTDILMDFLGSVSFTDQSYNGSVVVRLATSSDGKVSIGASGGQVNVGIISECVTGTTTAWVTVKGPVYAKKLSTAAISTNTLLYRSSGALDSVQPAQGSGLPVVGTGGCVGWAFGAAAAGTSTILIYVDIDLQDIDPINTDVTTGTVTGTPTGHGGAAVTIIWRKVGKIVTLQIPQCTGTSTTTAYALVFGAALPNLQAFVAEGSPCYLSDNAGAKIGYAMLINSNSLIFYYPSTTGVLSTSGFTATGTKGNQPFILTYICT